MTLPRLACTVRPWAQFPFERALDAIAAAGYDAVALPVHGVTSVITSDTPAAQAREIGAAIDDYGLDLVVLSHAADLDRSDDAALATLRGQLDHCARLGVRTLVDMGCPDLENGERYLRLMAAAAPCAAELGVTIAVKPHGGITRSAADTLSVVHRVGHEAFQICWDPGNLVHYGGEPPGRGLAEAAPYIGAVGVRDHPAGAIIRPGRGMPPALTPGDGMVDFVELYRILRTHGFTGPSAVENVTKLGTVADLTAEADRARRNLLDAMAGRRVSASTPVSPPRRSCSRVARAAAEDPIGTARPFDRYLMLELALPWPPGMGTPVWETDRVPPELRSALRAATRRVHERGLTMKTFAAAPDPDYCTPGLMRIIRFDRALGAAGPYLRVEHQVPTEFAPALIDALFPEDDVDAADALTAFVPYRDDAAHRDLVVCTHASVDACCGTYGYPLYRRLRDDHGSGRSVRVWRISSFGGHRFAPTLVDLPEGRVWGNLTPDRMAQLVERTGDPAQMMDLYRGWATLPSPAEQVLERELFRHYGWDWLDYRLTVSARGGDDYQLTLVDSRTGGTYRRTAEIQPLGSAPVLVGCDRTVGEVPRFSAVLHPEFSTTAP